MPVVTVLEKLKAGLTAEEVMEEFDVSREQLSAVLEFVTRSLKVPTTVSANTSSGTSCYACSFSSTTTLHSQRSADGADSACFRRSSI